MTLVPRKTGDGDDVGEKQRNDEETLCSYVHCDYKPKRRVVTGRFWMADERSIRTRKYVSNAVSRVSRFIEMESSRRCVGKPQCRWFVRVVLTLNSTCSSRFRSSSARAYCILQYDVGANIYFLLHHCKWLMNRVVRVPLRETPYKIDDYVYIAIASFWKHRTFIFYCYPIFVVKK